MIDLRSDTVSKPSVGMLEAMLSAQIGDDVFDDDASVKKLEYKVANMFGRESALFCVSGTMTNQIAISNHCQPGSEVLCEETSHVYLYEGGGIAKNSLSTVQTIKGNRGLLHASQLKQRLRPKNDLHRPEQRLVCLENTTNKGGGMCYNKSELQEIKSVVKNHGLNLHLDGARLFNAIIEKDISPEFFGEIFDSISICLSKGLGCPIGSLIVGDEDFIHNAKKKRKVMGGAWRQAGYLAEAGIYALDNNVERLQKDHIKAKRLEEILLDFRYFHSSLPVKTNIVIVQVNDNYKAEEIVKQLFHKNILCLPFGDNQIRFVTHLDISDDDIEDFKKTISNLKI